MSSEELAATTADPQIKLRQSCDACAAAKVKCDKDHPRCERCVARGSTCVYGASRKYGKLAYRRRLNNDAVSSTETLGSDSPKSTGSRRRSSPVKSLDANHQHIPLSMAAQGPMLSPPSGTPLALDKTLLSEWTESVDEIMHDYDSASRAGSEWATLLDPVDIWMYGPMGEGTGTTPAPGHMGGPFSTASLMDDTSLASMTDTTNSSAASTASSSTQPTYDSHDRHNSLSSSTSLGFTSLYPSLGGVGHHKDGGGAAAAMSTTDYFATSIPLRDSVGMATNGHACSQLAYMTLASIHSTADVVAGSNHLSQSHVSVGVGVGAGMPNGAASSASGIDSILNTNRAAIANVIQLLQCPCANDPHNAILYSSIVSKVLRQYQVAAGIETRAPPSARVDLSTLVAVDPAIINDGRSGASAPDLSVNSASGTACMSTSSSSTNLVRDAVKIGTFSPDAEDQEPMRRLLLLGELRRASQLVDLLTSRQPEAGMTDGADDLYATLGAWLTSEMNRITKTLRAGLRAAVCTP